VVNLIYPLVMRASAAIPILLLPFFVDAGVYKWRGTDGQIQYSDRPVTGAERVGIAFDRYAPASGSGDTAEETDADPGPYSAFEIAAPEPNQTIRDAEGELQLSLLVNPPLAADHRLQILVDGHPVPGEIQGTQISIKGLSFGSHRLQARIRDLSDVTIASSLSIDFHLRKPLPENLRP
jgi:hypothetical protein